MKYSYKQEIINHMIDYKPLHNKNRQEFVSDTVSLMDAAQVFRIPSIYSLPSVNNYKDFYEFMGLPYDYFFIELALFGKDAGSTEYDSAIFVSKTDIEGEVSCLFFAVTDDIGWMLAGGFGLIMNESDYEIKEANQHPLYQNLFKERKKNPAEALSWILFMFLVCLNTPNIELKEVKPPKLINLKRAKKGRPLISGYKFLDLPCVGGLGETARDGGKKRTHWRRGHIRRLKDRTTWVKASLIGADSDYFIDKTYRLYGAN